MTGRIALITGAGSGIGRAAAVALSLKGYRLALAGRRPDALDETAAMLAGEAVCLPTDVTRKDSIDALFEAVKDRYGRLDLLFNNAGIAAPPVPLEDLDADAWRRVIDTNLNGAFFCLQAAFRMMKEQDPMGGRIINNGSISAHTPRPSSIAYTASKHAITGLTKSTSLDGRRYNIACGQIDIGNAASPMAAQMAKGMPQANGTIAPEPVMDVANVGEAICFMDSLPLESNVQFITLMATNMPFIGRG